MLAPNNHVLSKYKSFVVKMGDDMARNASAKNNYMLLCDCDIFLSLTCVLLVLEAIYPSYPKRGIPFHATW
jgi:hypothetical protein